MNSALPGSCYFCTCSLVPFDGFAPRCMGQQRSSAISGLQCIHLVLILQYSDFFLFFFSVFQACARLASAHFRVSLLFPTLVEVDWNSLRCCHCDSLPHACSCTLSKSERERGEPHFASILADRRRGVHPVALILTEISARAVHDGNKYFII